MTSAVSGECRMSDSALSKSGDAVSEQQAKMAKSKNIGRILKLRRIMIVNLITITDSR